MSGAELNSSVVPNSARVFRFDAWYFLDEETVHYPQHIYVVVSYAFLFLCNRETAMRYSAKKNKSIAIYKFVLITKTNYETTATLSDC